MSAQSNNIETKFPGNSNKLAAFVAHAAIHVRETWVPIGSTSPFLTLLSGTLQIKAFQENSLFVREQRSRRCRAYSADQDEDRKTLNVANAVSCEKAVGGKLFLIARDSPPTHAYIHVWAATDAKIGFQSLPIFNHDSFSVRSASGPIRVEKASLTSRKRKTVYPQSYSCALAEAVIPLPMTFPSATPHQFSIRGQHHMQVGVATE
ncbi:predicted protein [Plenodomus lingam JN3]|uniref:Predicted protein n=1 Tax=Leptosphaeria maculans (strain JN3 / isolate v23.1.3 / race Av1-4-5-6-7-8) TaxID=985895 RepID=E4ZI53_LEPMJ|nr:predicted protein [Plenodomus lingam JN3]CBX91196.1 predicted protein [Plenodomus lingam JN3]